MLFYIIKSIEKNPSSSFHTSFQNADLTGAVLDSVIFEKADMTGAIVDDAIIEKADAAIDI